MSAYPTAIPPVRSLICLGVNFHCCPLSVREQFAVSKTYINEAHRRIAELAPIDECVLLSTCNRTEIYAWGEDAEQMYISLLSYFLGSHDETLAHYFYRYDGADVLKHLAQLSAGLDSMVIGETEIFGQVKEAYRVALQEGTTGTYSNRVFQRIFSIGKKVRTQTHITAGPTSVGAAAVQMAMKEMGSLAGKRVLIMGAGDVARSTAQSLMSRGAEALFVANRSYDRAVELAEQVGGTVIRFSEWGHFFDQIDIVIVSTASPAYVVQKTRLEEMQERRGHRPLFLMDLSVPRNVDPACAELAGVHLYDIDALEMKRQDSSQLRLSEMSKCESLIECWLADELQSLLSGRQVSYPVLHSDSCANL